MWAALATWVLGLGTTVIAALGFWINGVFNR